MGKLTKKILGTTRGKVGDVVFAKFRQETVDRAYQPKVHNPRTAAQVLNRVRFATTSNLAQGLAKAINLGMKQAVAGTNLSPRNLFTKLNDKNDVVEVSAPDTVTIAWSNLKIAKGGFEQPQVGSVDFDTDPLTVGIPFTSPSEATNSDVRIVGVVYNPDENKVVVRGNTVSALTNNTLSITVPTLWNGSKCYVYAWFEYIGDDKPEESLYKGMVSDSVYGGSGNIA